MDGSGEGTSEQIETPASAVPRRLGRMRRAARWAALPVVCFIGGAASMYEWRHHDDVRPSSVESGPGSARKISSLENNISLVGYPVAIEVQTASGKALFEAEFTRSHDGRLLLRSERRLYALQCIDPPAGDGCGVISNVSHAKGYIVLHSPFGTAQMHPDDFSAIVRELALRSPGGSAPVFCIDCRLDASMLGETASRKEDPLKGAPNSIRCTLLATELHPQMPLHTAQK